jgi:hypothetical protein
MPHPDNPPPRRFWAMPPSEFMPGQDQGGAAGQVEREDQDKVERQERDQGQEHDRDRDQGMALDRAEPGRLGPGGGYDQPAAGSVHRDGLITGVPLGGGVVLLLPAAPTGDDVARIQETTRELMGLLAIRGLAGTPDDTSRAGNATEREEQEAEPAASSGSGHVIEAEHETRRGRGRAGRARPSAAG